MKLKRKDFIPLDKQRGALVSCLLCEKRVLILSLQMWVWCKRFISFSVFSSCKGMEKISLSTNLRGSPWRTEVYIPYAWKDSSQSNPMLHTCKVVCCFRLQKEIDVVKNCSSIEKLRREKNSFCFCGTMVRTRENLSLFALLLMSRGNGHYSIDLFTVHFLQKEYGFFISLRT